VLILTRRIKEAIKTNGYEQAFLIGPQGMGKTTYAMLVAKEIYGSWDKALDHLFFDPTDAFRRMTIALDTMERLKLVIFDDAGFYFSKYMFMIEGGAKLASVINWIFNVIRTVCAGVIFTSVSEDILKELRKKSWVIGEPRTPAGERKNSPRRVMHLYVKRLRPYPPYRQTVKIGMDYYRLDVWPEDIRFEYELRRREAMRPYLRQLPKLMREIMERRPWVESDVS